jgi:hypothetical protein
MTGLAGEYYRGNGVAVTRVLFINPNCSVACSAGIDAAIAPFRFAGGPALDVATLADGPPAVYSWRDWHAAVGPLTPPTLTSSPVPPTRGLKRRAK